METNMIGEKYSLFSPAEAHYTVYRLTDPEGKMYIGCTGLQPKRRWGKGYTKNTPVRKAIDKIGWENFEKSVCCENLTREGAEKLERWFIAYYDSANPEKGYNCALGGLGKGVCMNEATKELNSVVKIRQYREDPDYRERVRQGIQKSYRRDPGHRERVRKGVLEAYRRDPEYRERLKRGHQKAYENDPNYWKKVSFSRKRFYAEHPEEKEKIRQRMREYLSKPENRAFIDSDSHAKPVICVETGEYYPSQSAAEKATGLYGIHKVCAGKKLTSGGFHWRYAETVD